MSLILRVVIETTTGELKGIGHRRLLSMLTTTCRMWGSILLPMIRQALVTDYSYYDPSHSNTC
ncbi:hypothetical protein DL89DRAFT_269631, partial [Linderina pennispora]